jgi:hypothetical protein
MAQALRKELKTYEKHRQQLEASEGKFVLISADKVVGTYDTYEAALAAGYEKFGLAHPFLVKQISANEGVAYFSRDLGRCLTS